MKLTEKQKEYLKTVDVKVIGEDCLGNYDWAIIQDGRLTPLDGNVHSSRKGALKALKNILQTL